MKFGSFDIGTRVMKGYGTEGDNDEPLNKGKKTTEDLKKENESLHQENLRLQQVLQDVTAVNKRWQRYNNDRRMYVQKLLATIQELQEQMNQLGEAALQRPTPASADSGLNAEIDRLRRQYDEHTQVLRLQIKSHKDDWEVERREKSNALKERDTLVEEVKKLEEELSNLRILLDQEKHKSARSSSRDFSGCSSRNPSPRLHDKSHVISSQDFAPTTFKTSFQVPFSPNDELSSPYADSEKTSFNIVEQEDSNPGERSSSSYPPSPLDEATSKSVYLGYPNSGLASVCAFTGPGPSQPVFSSSQESTKDSIICPNCSRLFPPSLHSCFQDHFEFCKETDTTRSTYSFS